MATIKRTEYYVVYYFSSSSDTKNQRYSSSIFTSKESAEKFMNSMLSQGAIKAEVKTMEYLYEEKDI